MCCHINWTGARSPYSKQEKLDYLVSGTGWSDFVETSGSQGHCWAAMRSSSSDQAMSGPWRGLNHDNPRSCGGG
jgi:hypothetical protein